MADYFLTYTDPSLRGTWATYTYVDALASTVAQEFIDVYDYIDNSSIGTGGGASKAYVDGSLYLRDVSIAWLAANSGGDATKLYVDASLLRRDASLDYLYNNTAYKTYTDGSLAARDASIGYLNSQLGSVYNNNYIDGSLNSKTNWSYTLKQDASILRIDTSINNVIVLNNYWQLKLANSTKGEASTGYAGQWSYDSSSLYICISTNTWKHLNYDSSITSVGATISYVDGSISALNASVNTALGTYATNSSVNTALGNLVAKFTTLGTSYTVNASDNNNVIFADVSALTITFPNTLSVGFQTTVVNTTTGITTLNASTLHTVDSSVVLRDKNAAASIVCRSAGVFYAFGNLK